MEVISMGIYLDPGNEGFQRILPPYSVMLAMRKFGSYWQKTSAAESLMTYINMDFEGSRRLSPG